MLCKKCGNEVDDPLNCEVCTPRRKPRERSAKMVVSRPCCPRCRDPLDLQDWDGVQALQCPSCRGTFFPERGLEATLNKLRATCSPMDVQSVMADFKERFHRELPDAIRYKACPVCDTAMMRRNYGRVSGAVIDVCGEHGTWVDEVVFGSLADFVCRGGDLISERVSRHQTSLTPNKKGGANLLDRLFGGG